ncbi:MAG: trehalose-6-phosphate synthase [Candidatus Staskawiczbacteria bacterium]|nr:trehalose-6-phosphate synthase [Candidatus Staskawiczbacteria bacterium]
MDQFWSIIIGALVLTSIIVLGFTVFQVHEQQVSLLADLKYRTQILSESFKESIEPIYIAKSIESLQKILDKFTDKQRLMGLAVYDNKGNVVASSAGLSEEIVNNAKPTPVMDADSASGNFATIENSKIYEFINPMHQDDAVIGAIMVVQNADYIGSDLTNIWTTNLLRLFLQVLIFAIAAVFVLRWLIFRPILKMIKSIKAIRSGNIEQGMAGFEKHSFFKPLAEEISKISDSLSKARLAAAEEARLRMEKLDTPWTAERLKEFVKTYLKGRKIFAVSNREPYVHSHIKNEIICSVPASGMVTAVEPVMESCGGVWLAQATGDADKETADANGKIQVPPDDPKYTLKRIWISEKERKGFYAGFSNEALWPLCHNVHNRPIFRKEDWQEYRRVNGKFAQNLLQEIEKVEKPLVLVQDFHFAILPQMIKKSRPDAKIGLFWHVPWPSPEVFNICPQHKEILEGMLGADIIGFHTQQYCNNFMETVGKEIESIVDLEQFSITFKGHVTHIRPFPISVAFASGEDKKSEIKKGKEFLEKFGVKTEYIGLGVDRLDYTKGILERLKGVEFFLELYPAYKEKFTFLQIAPISREEVEKYRQFNEEVTAQTERINEKFQKNGWKPIILVKEHLSHEELNLLYRQADFCLVTPLHDGMNLVSKEFVAARNDESGVLILSQFAGASKELKGAIIINPYSAEQTASSISEALNMPSTQQHSRMKKMRQALKNYNVYRWSAEFMKAVASLD